MTSRRVLIAGCGYVGSRLAERLRDRGHEVIGLRRDVARLPPGIVPACADLAAPASLAAVELPGAIDAVVYAAAAGAPDDAAYRRAYVDGPRNLLAELESRGQRPQRVIYTSSTGVYPQDEGQVVDETSEVDGDDGRGTPRVDRVREGERVFESFATSHVVGAEVVIVRFGGIYGPGRERLVESVRSGTIEYGERPRHFTNRIHREDCAGVLEHLLTLPSPHRLYAAVDDEPAPLDDVVRFLASCLALPVPPPRPSPPAADSPPATGKRVANARLRASGYAFTYPTYREGYAAILREKGTSPQPS
jgi:nucleoside-diphosphate-sugar epimerase